MLRLKSSKRKPFRFSNIYNNNTEVKLFMVLKSDMIKKNIPIPLYYQLKEIILGEIVNRNLLPGDSIPTENDFSSIFGISRSTVRQAIMELVNDGYLNRVKSKGTFVSKPKINLEYANKNPTFNEQIIQKGMVPKTIVLEKKLVSVTADIASILGVSINDNVISLLRLRFADNEPIVIVDAHLSYPLCSAIMERNLENESLYDILSENNESKVYKVVRTIEATTAGKYESDLLQINRGYPIQLFKSIAYNSNGKAIEYSISKYRGDRNQLTVELYI